MAILSSDVKTLVIELTIEVCRVFTKLHSKAGEQKAKTVLLLSSLHVMHAWNYNVPHISWVLMEVQLRMLVPLWYDSNSPLIQVVKILTQKLMILTRLRKLGGWSKASINEESAKVLWMNHHEVGNSEKLLHWGQPIRSWIMEGTLSSHQWEQQR